MERTRKPLAGRRLGPVVRPATCVIVGTLAGAMIAMTPLSAGAETGVAQPSTSEIVSEAFVSAVDIAVIRPVGIFRIVVGAALLVPSTVFNAIGLPLGKDPAVFKDDFDRMVVEPIEYTFSRPVGVDLAGS